MVGEVGDVGETLTSAGAVAAFAPDWCLFWGENVVNSQLDIWLPYLRRSRYRYSIMSGHDAFSDSVRSKIEALPNSAIVEPTLEARAWLRQSPRFRGFLYIGTKQENFKVVNSFPHFAHVWLGHGDSEKRANAFRTVSLYDAVLMARYSNVRRFPRPVRRWVWNAACATGATIVEGALKDPWPAPRTIRTILYAPTWEGYSDTVDYSSLPAVAPLLLESLPWLAERGTKVIMRPHPGTGARLPERRALVDQLWSAGVERTATKAEAFTAADVMISDISGVTGEFLFTEKPSLMPVHARLAVARKDRASLERDYPWAYLWDIETDDLAAIVSRLEGADPLRGRRAAAARQMFRGHRSLDEAVRTFDTALSIAQWRKVNVPLRFVFEAALRLPWLAPRLARAGRGGRNTEGSPAEA